ncbi:hypothetical protein FTUN_8160 [Frigoriglobus tundricola]|uniref:Potassium channel domain-containing protein n=1 Tax=Frigoriglobus tundricola TaxID=2774151 RepID=A0A6M5Z2A1_9BACT|nr:hypothetical protein FTUN_8160 [Frigoriglobus tundricola]
MRRHHLLRFEGMREPLLPTSAFARRVARSFAVATLLIGVSLAGGMAGYAGFEGMAVIDAFVNASMILSGMGPLDAPKTFSGKLFAGTYALYSGLVLILAAGVVLAPIVHRLLHQFHVDDEDGK